MSPSPPPGLDPERLRGHLDRERPGLVGGPLTARLIEGGRSNLTYLVGDGSHDWVVRRPPLGHVLATAHDMKREFRVISALHPTAVPVPAPLLLCEDPEVLGAPFYLMEYVTGTPYRTAGQLAPLGPARTHAAVLGLVDTLVALHAVDPGTVGLGDFGGPRGSSTANCAAGPSSWTPHGTGTSPGWTSCTRRSAVPCPSPPRPPSCTATTGSTTS